MPQGANKVKEELEELSNKSNAWIVQNPLFIQGCQQAFSAGLMPGESELGEQGAEYAMAILYYNMAGAVQLLHLTKQRTPDATSSPPTHRHTRARAHTRTQQQKEEEKKCRRRQC